MSSGNGSDDGLNGMPSFENAEDGEEMQAADKEAQKAKLMLAEKRLEGDAAIDSVRMNELDIVRRGKALASLVPINYPDKKSVRMGDMYVTQALPTDGNRWAAFEVLFGEGEDRPHVDEFRGRIVDHAGRIVDDYYPMVDIVKALDAMALKGQSASSIRAAYREWAMMRRSNDLIKRIDSLIPEWDGVERIEMKLIEMFQPHDTPLNRSFGRYFWLSLYCRIMHPGCNAPMVLSLFGGQDAGKSYFAKLICMELMGNDAADSVQLNLAADSVEFLREITGASIIASVGEMTGFTRGDLNKIKDFITRTSDKMHYKFEGHFTQLRQWITVLDGNKYEGLQRDDTGNRRFYPMFVCQLADRNGQPHWKEGFSVDFNGFRESLWQIMAECRAWLAANDGMRGYQRLVSAVSKDVAAFSREEMKRDRGTIRDDKLDTFLIPVIKKCNKTYYQKKSGSNVLYEGVAVMTSDFAMRYSAMARGSEINFRHLKTKMESIGGEARVFTDGVRGYLFKGFTSIDEFEKNIGIAGREDIEDAELMGSKDGESDGGF